MFSISHLWSPLAWVFLCWQVFHYSISYLLLVCSGFLFLLQPVLVECMLLGIHPFLLGCPICLCTIVHNSLMIFFYFCGISYNVSSFNADCIYLSLLSFFLDQSNSGFVDIIFLKKQLLVPLIFFLLLFCSLFHFCCSNLYYFFPSVNFGQVFELLEERNTQKILLGGDSYSRKLVASEFYLLWKVRSFVICENLIDNLCCWFSPKIVLKEKLAIFAQV